MMSLLGAGEVVGGLIFGQIRDNLGNRMTIVTILSSMSVSFTLVFIVNNVNKYNFTAWLMCFFWGVTDSGLNNFVLNTLGFQFESKSTPFSV